MEGQSSLTGGMIMEGLNSFQDLQGAMQLHHQQDPNFYQPSCVVQVQPESVFPLRWQYMEEQPLSYIDYNEDRSLIKLFLKFNKELSWNTNQR